MNNWNRNCGWLCQKYNIKLNGSKWFSYELRNPEIRMPFVPYKGNAINQMGKLNETNNGISMWISYCEIGIMSLMFVVVAG